jgi:hypothetical protein
MWRPSEKTERRTPARITAWAVLIGCLLIGTTARGDRIVLRNLKIISDTTVASFDEDGVRLSGGKLIGWDEIERISVAEDRQEQVDRLLSELGTPLYRIRQRLQVGDYEGLLPHAEAIYPRYLGRSGSTAYMVKQAYMWGLLSVGRREEAVAPYLGCYNYVRNLKGRPLDLPGRRRLTYDPGTGMTPDLRPVWFDPAAAKKELPAVLKAAAAMRQPLPVAARIYYASLALTAGEQARAERVLAGIEDRKLPAVQLTATVKAQAEVLAGKPGPALSGLETSLESVSPENKPLALYWLGKAKTSADVDATRRDGVLQLLHIPAIYGDVAPELAAAALHQAMLTLAELGDARGSIAVRKELLGQYGHTHFARVVKNELSPRKDDESG